jgi:FkbM family methyltransferase
VLYDVGANIGVFSLYAGSRGHRVVAFEPVAANYAVLNRNIEINGLGGRVTAFCVALDQRDGTGALFLENTHAGVSSQFERRLEATRFEQGAVSFALDTLLAGGRLPFPDHLKIDVDGTEGRILTGAARTLADRRLKSIQIELSPAEGDRDTLVRMIEAHGFRGREGVRANMTFTRV